MATPHNIAKIGDFAKTVLMPGDPMRAKFIAENFLDNAVLVNDIRGINGYTGTYKGVKVSVMASGMGIPSIGIYSYELFKFYDVDNIIRVGSAGSLNEKINVRDIVVGMGACTTSRFYHQYNLNGSFSSICSYKLLKCVMDTAENLGITNIFAGNLLSSDAFYGEDEINNRKWSNMGVLAIEMEAAGLYMNASRLGKNAIAICTISDYLFKNDSLSSNERETSFTQMISLALETAVKLNEKE